MADFLGSRYFRHLANPIPGLLRKKNSDAIPAGIGSPFPQAVPGNNHDSGFNQYELQHSHYDQSVKDIYWHNHFLNI